MLNASVNKKHIVVSQSMYFPWVGLLEQIKVSDVFVHYDDVQFARGFYNRVQIKTQHGIKWLTVPLRDYHRGQNIDEVLIDERKDWRSQHRDVLRQTYLHAPFRDEMLQIVDSVFTKNTDTVSDISKASMLELAKYFDVHRNTKFFNSKDLDVKGKSSQRLHDIVKGLYGDVYVTGHGARNYLNHEIFENSCIEVMYMDYQRVPYPQLYGEFTPYVTSLDLVANCGKSGADIIRPQLIYWKEFIDESN